MNLTYQQLIIELTNLVEASSSGTLFIRTNCNHAITVTLEIGQITALYFGPRKGRKAIPLILGVTGGSCHFEDSGPGRPPQDLPSSQETLTLLRAGDEAMKASSGSQFEQALEVTPGVWRRHLAEVEIVLTDHLGPIAGILLEEAVTESGGHCATEDEYRRLIGKLVLNIEPDQIARFHSQIAALPSGKFKPC